MSRGAELLQGLKKKMLVWSDPIRRATGASTVLFLSSPDGSFIVQVRYLHQKTDRLYTKHFTPEYVFGSTLGPNPLTLRVQRLVCDYARDVIRDVLEERGAL